MELWSMCSRSVEKCELLPHPLSQGAGSRAGCGGVGWLCAELGSSSERCTVGCKRQYFSSDLQSTKKKKVLSTTLMGYHQSSKSGWSYILPSTALIFDGPTENTEHQKTECRTTENWRLNDKQLTLELVNVERLNIKRLYVEKYWL
jgi:uncharacterized protein YhdP